MRDRSSSIESIKVRGTACALIRVVVTLVAIVAAGPAGAQVYKWVDGSGVTHYSDKAPEKGGSAGKVDVVADRISVYQQDPNLMRQAANPGNWILADRVDQLERQLQAERQAWQYASTADDSYGGYYPYGGVPVIVVAGRRLHPNLRPVIPVSGRIAGNFNVRNTGASRMRAF